MPVIKVNTSSCTHITRVRCAFDHGLWSGAKKILSDPEFCLLVGLMVVAADFVLSFVVIRSVRYTEIDWMTYMEQVEKFMNGTRDYGQIYGSTGPLVYPAGHLVIFTGLRFFFPTASHIPAAQHFFLMIYTVNSLLVVLMYSEMRTVPPYALVFMFLSSYRVHSIFLLRLFNDPIAVTIFHFSLICFMRRKWLIGSLFFSFAVSVKMNILLFAPGLLLLFLEDLSIRRTLAALSICAAFQVVVGAPFLLHSAVNYVRGAFDLSRVFLFKWTVNWRFVPEHWFTSRTFHFTLLLCHLLAIVLVHRKRWAFVWRTRRLAAQRSEDSDAQPFASRVAVTLFTVNLTGILFARSLHYQFYVWYFYSLPALLWSTSLWPSVRILVMLLMEVCWNTYPSTAWSSGTLLALHSLLLICVWIGKRSEGHSKLRPRKAE